MKVHIQDKAVLVVLNCAFSWGDVTDKEITDETITEHKAAKGSMRVRKTLLPNASGRHVTALRTALNSFYNGYHLPHTFSTLIKGQRIMPSVFGLEYIEKFGEAEAAIQAALGDLCTGYDAAVEEASRLLQGAFKADDYPPVSEIPHYLKFRRRFLPVPAGNQILNALGGAVAADVDSYVGEMMKTAAIDAKQRLRKAVARMAETLTKDGKIHDTMPGAINDLAATLPELAGLADDPELQTMVKEVKATLSGYSGDDFRNSKATATAVGKQALELLKRMGG